ncbi:hypothetical protein M405DRAFT_363222 [Rhizopogon salebrosus TDB-379]|nr:hypothetical protein M405DRAFT_363222 [Rhizopogon salebrosus TDB-379]
MEALRALMPPLKPELILALLSVDWSQLRDKISSWASYVLGNLTVVNEWTIDHPYITAFILLLICIKPGILLRPLRLTRKTAVYSCFLTWQLVTLPSKAFARFTIGFGRDGVEPNLFASQYQSSHYGHYGGPQGSLFGHLPSYGATGRGPDVTYTSRRAQLALFSLLLSCCALDDDECQSNFAPWVSCLSFFGINFVLGRAWGALILYLAWAIFCLILYGLSKPPNLLPRPTAPQGGAAVTTSNRLYL